MQEPTDQSFFDLAASLANRSAFSRSKFLRSAICSFSYSVSGLSDGRKYVVGVIFAFTHDVTLSKCRVPVGLSQMESQ